MLPYRDSRLIRFSLISFFIVIIIYAYFEAQGILFGPTIDVPNTVITMHDKYTVIKGRASRISELKLNGKSIPVTEDGMFEEPFILAEGSNHLILEARDARGRTREKSLEILYIPASQNNTSSGDPAIAP